jgi:hypothetical protein
MHGLWWRRCVVRKGVVRVIESKEPKTRDCHMWGFTARRARTVCWRRAAVAFLVILPAWCILLASLQHYGILPDPKWTTLIPGCVVGWFSAMWITWGYRPIKLKQYRKGRGVEVLDTSMHPEVRNDGIEVFPLEE